tara:strand:+ start:983 stop:1810 length:828 start_codon:yes stop_codon:yes gene_type:complete
MKTLILGKNGFIAKSFKNYVSNEKNNFKFISKKEINLLKKADVKKINNYLNNYKKIIFISAIAPAKNMDDLNANIIMISNFFNYVDFKKISHFMYISSDAVYSDTKKTISESSETSPNSYHGQMHLIRENIIKNYLNKNNICILRPTLIYGPGDTHNGYGPNLFKKLILNKEKIKLFGNGSEKRDHIHINDVITCIYKSNSNSISGTFNVTSGEVISFKEIAVKINKKFKNQSKIISIKRTQKMPHLGYRFLSNKKIKNKLSLEFMNFDKGLNYL